MIKITPQYLPAMHALNSFYDMLYDALLTAMPEATFSTSGAFVWRGYRIDSFKTLAINQYYCLISAESPKSLVFKESFQYRGKYRDFIKGEVDLLAKGFFERNSVEQKEFLSNFIAKAADISLSWQDSEERLKEVPQEFQSGKKNFRHKFKGKYTINHVTEDLIYAFPAQDKIFQLLIPGIHKACEKTLSKKVELIPNAHWCNWDFRGYRMKFLDANGKKPTGPSDFVWRIYHKEPTQLICERFIGKDYPTIPAFDLSLDFLSASEPEQSERLYQFVLKSLQANKV